MATDMACTANFQSELELIAEEIVEAFYIDAKLGDDTPVATTYPRIDNEAQLKEAFWLAMTAIMQVDQYVTISDNQTWPTQFDGIEWLPADVSLNTQSIKTVVDQSIQVKVELVTDTGIEEKTIVVYYTDEPSSLVNSNIYFSRWAFKY